MEQDRQFLSNPNIAAFLVLYKILLEYPIQNGFVLISAPKTAEVDRLISEFHGNAPVAVIDFIAALQEVRQRINAAKRGGAR